MVQEYVITDDVLQHNRRFVNNKYKNFLRQIDSQIRSSGKDSAYVNELADIVNKSCSLFSGVVEGVRNAFKQEPLLGASNDADNLLTTYALHIASRTVTKDLETAVEEDYSNSLVMDDVDLTKEDVLRWGDTDYNNVKNVLEGMASYVVDSGKEPSQAIKEYFEMYSDLTNREICSRVNKGVYSKLKEIQWKVGSYEIDGLHGVVITKNGKSSVPIDEREKDQFYTPLKDLSIDRRKMLSKSKIVGDHSVINYLEEMIDYLFFFDPTKNNNPYLEKEAFKSCHLLEGMPGEGKGAVSFHIIDYAERLSKRANTDLVVTRFEIDSSWKSGKILKLKSQFKQIGEENKLFLIFQDEITQILSDGQGNNMDESEDVILEFQKFMDGEYVNRGNYIFLTTTNMYDELPLAIRSRFDPPLSWSGASTPEQKSVLFQYKLEEGVRKGFVTVTNDEFGRLGQIAFDTNVSGRGINTICTNVKRRSIVSGKKSEVWKERGNYDRQLELIDQFRSPINCSIIEEEIASFVGNKIKSEHDSKRYRRS